jgi:integrase
MPILGRHPIGSIRAGEIERMLRALTDQGLSPGTVGLTWQHLRACLRGACHEGLIPRVPAVSMPRSEGRVAIPTTEEVEALYVAASPRMRVAITLASRAGLRRSEALALTVDRIDREQLTITVNRQAAARSSREPFAFAPLKTVASYRTVPVPAEVITVLPSEVEGEHGLLMTVAGAPWSSDSFGSAWRKLRKATDLPYTLHDLRHYFCSTLLSAGINPKAVATVAGHSSPVVTLRTYAHVMPDDDERIRQALLLDLVPLRVLRTG